MATGTGKTRCAIEHSRKTIVDRPSSWGMFVAHTDELVDQAAKAYGHAGLSYLVEKADREAIRDASAIKSGRHLGLNPDIRMVIGSKDTLQGKRLGSWPRDFFDFLIWDEAHRATADSWQAVRKHFAPAYLTGLTATPDRTDGRSLAEVFEPSELTPEGFVFHYSMRDAVDNGHLVPLQERICQTGIDLRDIRVNKADGDFNKGDLEDRINASLKVLANAVADEFEKLNITYAIVFTPQVLSAEAFSLALTKIGIPSQFVHGEHPDRFNVIQGFRERKYRVLCNADVLIEGADFPHCQASVIARPTKSRSRFSQMVGRSTRKCDDIGKDRGYIIQPAWIGADLKLVSSVDLFTQGSTTASVREAAKKLMEDGEVDDPKTALEVAEEMEQRRLSREAEADRRRIRVAEFTRENINCKVKVRDPLARLLGVTPRAQGGDAQPSKAVVDRLRMYGVEKADAVAMSGAEASAALAKLIHRDRLGLSTMPQVHRLVAECGFDRDSALRMSAKTACETFRLMGRMVSY